MFIIANFIAALAVIIHYVLTFYLWIVIARAVLSWVNPDPYNSIVRFIYNVTEPVLGWVRRRVPLNFGPVDFSPILVFLAIIFLQQFLVGSLQGLALSLR
jgi:YggT family protein